MPDKYAKNRFYLTDDLIEELEKLRVKFDDEKINQTARRVIRAGVLAINKKTAEGSYYGPG